NKDCPIKKPYTGHFYIDGTNSVCYRDGSGVMVRIVINPKTGQCKGDPSMYACDNVFELLINPNKAIYCARQAALATSLCAARGGAISARDTITTIRGWPDFDSCWKKNEDYPGCGTAH